jgi:hypothetical protein
MHVNKVHHVTTITRVAQDLGEDEDWLRGVANEMEIEDGVIWVYGVGEDGVLAFTDFGIENLVELVRVYKQYPELLRRADPPAAYAGRIRCCGLGSGNGMLTCVEAAGAGITMGARVRLSKIDRPKFLYGDKSVKDEN